MHRSVFAALSALLMMASPALSQTRHQGLCLFGHHPAQTNDFSCEFGIREEKDGIFVDVFSNKPTESYYFLSNGQVMVEEESGKTTWFGGWSYLPAYSGTVIVDQRGRLTILGGLVILH